MAALLIGAAINYVPYGNVGFNTEYLPSYEQTPIILADQTDEQFVSYTSYVWLNQDDEIGSTGSALTSTGSALAQ